MNNNFTSKLLTMFAIVSLLTACQSIPEWDKAMIDAPIEDGRCPDLSGKFNYNHLGAKDTSDFGSILDNDLPSNLPADRAVPADYKPGCLGYGAACIPIPFPSPDDFYPGHYASSSIYNKIYQGKFSSYSGAIIVVLTRLDQAGRKYHVKVDWDEKGLLGEYDFTFNKMWVCSEGNLFRSVKTTLNELPDPDEIDPKDYRRIYVLPNGNIRIDRKHTFTYAPDTSHVAKYYESRVFARVP